jgi:hypothetical protein
MRFAVSHAPRVTPGARRNDTRLGRDPFGLWRTDPYRPIVTTCEEWEETEEEEY